MTAKRSLTKAIISAVKKHDRQGFNEAMRKALIHTLKPTTAKGKKK